MSQTLQPTDFNKLINHLKRYYGEEQVQRAIYALIQFYKEESFDNEDITNDWIPHDFKNCDGIDRFMSTLNYPPPINSTQNKEILFNWFCYWLLPNVTKPTSEPYDAPPIIDTSTAALGQFNSEITIDEIANEFKEQLPKHISLLQYQQDVSTCTNMANDFAEFCKENMANIEHLLDDLDPELIDESSIMDAIMKNHDEYRHIKNEIFNVIYDIIKMHKYGEENRCLLTKHSNYPPFQLKHFVWQTTPENWRITNKLCTKEIPSFFRNEVEQQQCQNIKSTEDTNDWALMSAKALDLQNRFPFLMNIIDAFARYRAKENCILWCGCNINDVDIQNVRFQIEPKSIKAAEHETSVLLNPEKWFLNGGKASGFYNYVKKFNSDAADYIKSAIESLMKRSLHKFNFNHIMEYTIYDNYSRYCLYMCAMNKFLCIRKTQSESLLPQQIDLWIIPRLVKKDVSFATDDDDHDDIYEETILQLGKNESSRNETGKIRNLKGNLQDAGYEEGTDYWYYEADVNKIGVDSLKRHIINLWNKNDKCQHEGYLRYIMIIDRRNPQHLETNITNEDMKDDTHQEQKWADRMYLIRPKLKECKENNDICIVQNRINYDKIAKQYAVVLNETFIGNTKAYLFPMRSQNQGYVNHFSGLDAGNGYKFVVSFHLHFSNKVKMYWYFSGGAMRFFMKDICWLWPRYFKLRKKANEKDAYQILTDDAKIALNDVIKHYPLTDEQFDTFVKQLNAFK